MTELELKEEKHARIKTLTRHPFPPKGVAGSLFKFIGVSTDEEPLDTSSVPPASLFQVQSSYLGFLWIPDEQSRRGKGDDRGGEHEEPGVGGIDRIEDPTSEGRHHDGQRYQEAHPGTPGTAP